MNEHRFKFPFYLNADFIPKSDREGIQSDNPWNFFLFYMIGKQIVSMVSNYAGKSSVSCPLKPGDSAPLKHSTMPP